MNPAYIFLNLCENRESTLENPKSMDIYNKTR